MDFKVGLPEEAEIKEISQEAFEQLMGIRYIPHLLFETPRLLKRLEKKVEAVLNQNAIEQKQKWLGTYFGQEIRQGYIPDVAVKWIDREVGYGVFSLKEIPKFAFIGEYVGVLKKRRLFGRRSNEYCFDYSLGGLKSPYVIDAKDQGNLTRFINHSDHPNLEPASVYSDGLLHIILLTKQKIPPGTQLVYDYGEDFWSKRKKIKRLL